MNFRLFFTLIVLAMLSAVRILAQDTPKRPDWDQKQAVAIVKNIIALEEAGTPWDKIAWKTDPAEAVALARKEQKPIFVYFYLKKNVGPANAPC